MANRKNTFLIKRSNVPGKVPSPGDLQLGELALNTADAILYASGTTSNQILPIGWDRLSTLSGGTVNGNIASTGYFSGTTYYGDGSNLTGIPDYYVTGGTYSNGTLTLNRQNGSVTITGFTNTTLTATSLTVDYIDFNTGATVSQYPGRINWDAGTGTLNVNVGDANTGLIDLQVGQEEIVRVYNSEATTLQKGEIVYVFGSQGNRPSVKRASAVSDGYSVTTLGMVSQNIPSGSEGYVTTFGIISNLNTLGLTGGTPIWLSPTTPGGYTSTKPKAPDHTVLIGYVVRVSATVGSIFVNISNGWELDEIHDVRISAATEGDLLVRSSYSGTPVWVNSKTLNGNYTISGNTSHIGDFSVTGTVNTDTVQFNTAFTGSTNVGELSWSQSDGTLNIKMGGGNVTQQVGQEQYYQVLNQNVITGITNGYVIRAAGTDPTTGKILGDYMIADGTIPYYTTLGIATEDILFNNTGFVTEFGIVRDIDTTGALYGEVWSQGDILYASPTIPGGLTNVEPSSPNLKIQIALVLKLGSTDGSLFVRPSLGYTLGNLHNVQNAGLENNGDLLFYNGISSSWVYGSTLPGNYVVGGTLSASTFYGDGSNLTNIPDNFVTGGTYSSGTLTLNRQNGSVSITGFTTGGGGGGVDTYWVSGSTGTNSIKAINSTGLDATGDRALAWGNNTLASGNDSTAWGVGTSATTAGSTASGYQTVAQAQYSHSEGLYTTSSGQYSHSEGRGSVADANGSHAEGYYTTSSGQYSHSEGYQTVSLGYNSHAEGRLTTSSGYYSHAEGRLTTSSGNDSHAEGYQTTAIGFASHAEGYQTTASNDYSHAEGFGTIASGNYSHSEGQLTIASGNYSHSEGEQTTASGYASHAEGFGTTSSAYRSHAEGVLTTALGNGSHAEGYLTTSSGTYSHAEGYETITIDSFSHSEGFQTTASGYASHSEGKQTTASGDYSHTEGFNTLSVGNYSHAEGFQTTASNYSHSEGQQTTANGQNSHSEGGGTTSSGAGSHSEGSNTTASGNYSHSEGILTHSLGFASHAQGSGTTATGQASFASGMKSRAVSDGSFIHSQNSIVSGQRSVVLGGQNITGSTDDTVYVPNFNINTTPTTNNSLTNFLVRDTNGNISVRDYSSISTNTPNLVTVSLTGGTAQFTSIKAAVDSITGASATNPYVVKVGPGVFYENTITMKSYVDVVGESTTNTIVQANNPNVSLFIGADQSMINNLQIQGCTGTSVAAVVYSSSTTPQLNAIFYVENVRFGANYTHVKNVGTGGGNSIIQCSNVKYGGYPFTLGFYCTNDGSGIGRMQLRNVTSTNGGVTTTSGLVFAKADKSGCGFIVNGCLLTKSVGAATGTGFWVEDGGFLRLTGVNFQRWSTGIYAPQVGSAPSIDAIALNFENCTTDVDIIHSGATGKIQGTDNFLKTKININAPLYEVNQDPRQITVAKKGGDFSSIKSAVDYLIASGNTSVSNRFVISVGPGIFDEAEIDLTSTPYVSIEGSNIQTTLIRPSGNTQNIINLGVNNEISFLSLSGAPAGYAAIYAYDIGDFGQAHKISIYDCDTAIEVESVTQDTKFYGEYIDINGEFTYGVKVTANNNYIALANLENYYVFQGGTGNTYGNYATGSGATINITSSSLEGNGATGSTATLSRDGAFYNLAATDVTGWGYGHRVENVGNPSRFEYNGVTFTENLWDISVEQTSASGVFNGISSHEKITTLSQNVYWSFLDVDDGELDITRKASVTFTDGSHTDFTTLVFEGGPMGLMDGGEITTISGFTINTAQGYGYLEKSDNSGIVRRIDWTNQTLVLTSNSNLYIFINENGILSSSGTRPNSVYNIILGRVVTNATTVEFIDLAPVNAEHMANRYGTLLRNAIGPIYATGSIVTENVTPFRLDVSQGEYYYASNEYMPSGGTAISFTQYYRDGVGGWITTATTVVNSTSYDGNGSLSALTTGYYTKHTLYLLGDGSYEKYFLVLGQNEYSTLVQAEDALLPTPPSFFSDSVSQIANIYIQQGTTGITQIEDIRPVIGFKAGGVNASSVHGNLLGLSADDHLQYLLVDGGRAMSGNLDMGGNDITNVGTVDGVTVSSHATRHQFGGSDPVGSTTPSANAIPYADVNGTLDSWVSTASTTTLGRVLLSSTPTSASSPIVVSVTDNGYKKAITGITYSANVITTTSVDGTNSNTTVGLRTKAGTVAGASFAGNPKKYTVTFTTPYPSTSYSIQITGGVNRTFTYESKTTTGFVINANANAAFTENVDWITIGIGES